MGRLLLAGLLAFIASLVATAASAHPMPQSLVEIHAVRSGWQLRLTLPEDRLAAALIQAGLVPDPGPGFAQYPKLAPDTVRRYITSHLKAQSLDGRSWSVRVDMVQAASGTRNEWHAQVALEPPPGAPSAPVLLDYGVITREIITHTAIATIVQDWQGGVLPGAPRLLGSLRGEELRLRIDHGDGSAWTSWFSLVMLGAHHILEGVDHLAFLGSLLLTVTVASVGWRWYPLEATRPILRKTVWRVSAFTFGHSLSLLATSLDWLPAAGQGVEVLIALSVAISALHAIVPLYPRREAWIAAGFGLIHGMAFATTIREMSLSTGQIVLATLGFNLGIEAVQLCLVALVLPLLMAARRKPWEPVLRIGLASVILAVALWWCFSRLSSMS